MTRRAKAGGESVGGKHFKGGQFISAEYIAKEQRGFAGIVSGAINVAKIQKAVEKANFQNINHAAFSISKLAKSKIKKRKSPNAPGQPPTTRSRQGKNLRAAIYVARGRESALIGPRASFIGKSGAAHEFGRSFQGDSFDERPYMGPALEESLPRIAGQWEGSVGE
jgi:hypothetical protein